MNSESDEIDLRFPTICKIIPRKLCPNRDRRDVYIYIVIMYNNVVKSRFDMNRACKDQTSFFKD